MRCGGLGEFSFSREVFLARIRDVGGGWGGVVVWPGGGWGQGQGAPSS